MVLYILVVIYFSFATLGYMAWASGCCDASDPDCVPAETTNSSMSADDHDHDDGDGHDHEHEDEGITIDCDHVTGVFFMTFVVWVSSLTGSIFGCCVVCCGNDEVDSDSG